MQSVHSIQTTLFSGLNQILNIVRSPEVWPRRNSEMATQQEKDAAQVFLSSIELDEFFDDVDFDELAYQGFDPILLLVHLKKKAASISDAEHSSNLAWLAALGSTRGTNLKKIKGKTVESGVKKLDALSKLYGLKSNPSTSTDPTLGRIAACFARQISYQAYKNGKLVSPVETRFLTDNFPMGLRVSTAGSLIPKEGYRNNQERSTLMAASLTISTYLMA